MGGGYGKPYVKAPKAADIHRVLRTHPNLVLPEAPMEPTPAETAAFVIEAVARYLSPPKIEGENDEFACIDVADAVRDHLGPELLRRLGIK